MLRNYCDYHSVGRSVFCRCYYFYLLGQQVIQEQIEKRRNKVREPLTWERVKYRFAMPMLFVVMIPIMLLVMGLANIRVENDINSGMMVIMNMPMVLRG